MESELKVCNNCNVEKFLDEFPKIKKNGKEYIRNVCYECRNEARKKSINKNKTFEVKETTTSNSNISSIKTKEIFSNDEINTLKAIIRDYNSRKYLNISDELKAILEGNIKRRKVSYTIQDNLFPLIEEYCFKNKISKSDLVNIALADFLKK